MTKIIIALDYSCKKKAMNLVNYLNPNIYCLKIGYKMFILFGKKFIYELKKMKFNIFLDLKFFDTPDTVFAAVQSVCDIGIWMLTVHTLGGKKMLKSAKLAVKSFKNDAPLLIGVTVLTSSNIKNLKNIGITKSIKKYTLLLAKLSFDCHLNGIVCPGITVPYIKKKICNINNNKFKYIVPGIRMKNDIHNDQYNIITPKIAKKNKIDYIVLGRSITKSKNPLQCLKKIFS